MYIYTTLIIKEKEAMNMRRCGGGRKKGEIIIFKLK